MQVRAVRGRYSRVSVVAPMAWPERVRPWHRARLMAEIVAAYVPLLRVLRGNDLAAMVAAARSPRTTIGAPRDPSLAAERLGWIVNRVLKLFPTDGRCLIQSLVVTRLLAARSIESRLVIGVSVHDSFEAHAWVEHAGTPVLPAGHFARLHEL
jgi:Transglutaminase-like superfamily